MSKKPKRKPDDPEQSRRFEEAAKQAEVDESGAAFERALGVIVPKKAHRPGDNETPPEGQGA